MSAVVAVSLLSVCVSVVVSGAFAVAESITVDVSADVAVRASVCVDVVVDVPVMFSVDSVTEVVSFEFDTLSAGFSVPVSAGTPDVSLGVGGPSEV